MNNSKLMEILNEVFFFARNIGGQKIGLHPEEAAAQIKQLLKETVVLEERQDCEKYHFQPCGCGNDGWNVYRAEVLKRIDALDLPAGRHT